MQLIVFLAGLLASAMFTRWVRNFAGARGWYSVPNAERHIHTRPIPRMGGVAIYLALWCTVLLGELAGHFGAREFVFSNLTLKILGPATIIFLLGLIDDFWGVSAYTKFAVQAGWSGPFF